MLRSRDNRADERLFIFTLATTASNEKCNYFLKTSDTQFGFKKGLGCNHAIYSVRTIVESFVRKGSTVNLCAIDLSKAFDKVNLHALFIKLMKRNVPIQLLGLLENMLFDCHSCVKWENVYSDFFTVMFGVRHGLSSSTIFIRCLP